VRKKTLRCNLRNVPQRKFSKIHLPKIPHSAKYTFPLRWIRNTDGSEPDYVCH